MYKLVKIKKLLDYGKGLEIQKKAYEEVLNQKYMGIVFILEHNPVFTVGISGKEENLLVGNDILEEKGIQVIYSDRGGDITFHGPGQIIVYPVMNIRKIPVLKNSVKIYVEKLQQVVVETLKQYGIESCVKENYIGVWTNDKKIAAFGSKVIRGISKHGMALNVKVDKKYFQMINPCGITEYGICSVEDIISDINIEKMKESITENIEKVFGIVFSEREEIFNA